MISFTLSAQDFNPILEKYYPSADEPGGIVLLKKDNIQLIKPFGLVNLKDKMAVNDSTHFRMASVSKQITAMAVYQLIRQQKLSFDSKISSIFSQLSPVTKNITVAHLLHHSSGIWDYEELIPNNLDYQLMDADVLKLVAPIDSVYFEAGKQFRYSNTAYCLLALLVEKISGMSYPAFVENNLFLKQGVNSAKIYTDSMRISNRAYGYHPVNGEFKFADQSLTSATKGDGGVYISALEFGKWADQSNSFYDEQFFEDLEHHKMQVSPGIYYSLGWFFSQTNKGNVVLFHSGESTGFHNIVVFEPAENELLITFTNRDDSKIKDLFEELSNNNDFKIDGIDKPLFEWLSKVYAHQL